MELVLSWLDSIAEEPILSMEFTWERVLWTHSEYNLTNTNSYRTTYTRTFQLRDTSISTKYTYLSYKHSPELYSLHFQLNSALEILM